VGGLGCESRAKAIVVNPGNRNEEKNARQFQKKGIGSESGGARVQARIKRGSSGQGSKMQALPTETGRISYQQGGKNSKNATGQVQGNGNGTGIRRIHSGAREASNKTSHGKKR